MSIRSYQRVKKAYKKSNRSRLRKSKARSARKLSRSKHKLKPVRTYRKYKIKMESKKFFNIISSFLPRNYEIYDFINEGANGAVFLICNKLNNGDCKALKIALLENYEKVDDFIAEVKYNKIFAEYRLGPKIYSHKIFKYDEENYGLIVMEKIDGTLEDLLKTRKSKEVLDTIINWIEYCIKMMCKYNLTHGDLHWGNIGYKFDSEGNLTPIIIDFGWANRIPCQPILELLQLIRTVEYKFTKMDYENRKYLKQRLITIFEQDYKLSKNVEKQWDKISDSYYEILRHF